MKKTLEDWRTTNTDGLEEFILWKLLFYKNQFIYSLSPNKNAYDTVYMNKNYKMYMEPQKSQDRQNDTE